MTDRERTALNEEALNAASDKFLEETGQHPKYQAKTRAIIQAYLSALASRQEGGDEVGEWQPIETAPKDGTWFLGFNGSAIHLFRNRQNGKGFVSGGCIGKVIQPTHWMPLPHPPQTPIL